MTKINDNWDVVVIGAGLAGTVVSTQLADAGARVLLVEAKRFPRPKTCGGCLNTRAVEGLERAGLGDVLRGCDPVPLDRIELHHAGRSLSIGLPAGQAVTRETLDEALLAEARRRGVAVREGVRAKVAAEVVDGLRSVELRGEGQPETVKARMTLACDGLGHPSLASVPGFSTVVAPQSRAGIGAVIDDQTVSGRYPRGGIVMAVAERGYVGLAVCERSRLNIAAAFDPEVLRKRSAGEAVAETLSSAGLPELPEADSVVWRGSPRLSQHAPQVAGERVLLLGDAAGYVEPFTGEGMAAAIEGALAAAPIALRGADAWSADLADEWQTTYTKTVRRGQNACRAIAWMLKRPLATRIGLGAASVAPAIGRAVAAKVSAG